MRKILYIAGYGRSGSTILETILGNHAQITGVGEISLLWDEWNSESRVCACGKSYAQCEFWGDFIHAHPDFLRLSHVIRKVERLSSLPALLLDGVDAEYREEYRNYQEALFDYVADKSGSSIIVDSSKSARDIVGRFYALNKIAGQDIYVLHLIRNGLSAVESLTAVGRNWALEGYAPPMKWATARSAVGWASANFWAASLAKLGVAPTHYMQLRYEDLIADPAAAIQRIGEFAGFDASELIQRIQQDEYFTVGHVVGGNRVRMQGAIRLRRNAHTANTRSLKAYQRLVFALVGGWLNSYFGYSMY